MTVGAFGGFPKQTVRFLAGLRDHNDKAWFEAHRDDYGSAFVAPALAFAEAMEPRLRRIEPDVQVEARKGGSLMRVNRDIRFSKDKRPYKDHLDLWFWTGTRKSWDSSGFFFRLTPETLLLGAGMHVFQPDALARYRAAVVDERRGAELARVVAKLRKLGYEVGTETFKKTPRGLPADHARAALLRHGDLHAGWEGRHPRELGTPAFVDFVAKHLAAVAPVHRFLRTL